MCIAHVLQARGQRDGGAGNDQAGGGFCGTRLVVNAHGFDEDLIPRQDCGRAAEKAKATQPSGYSEAAASRRCRQLGGASGENPTKHGPEVEAEGATGTEEGQPSRGQAQIGVQPLKCTPEEFELERQQYIGSITATSASLESQ